MLKIIAAVVVVIIIGILGYASTKPDSFRYERKTTIKAPPEKIAAILNDLHRGVEWSPFEKMDPNMKRTFSGAEKGVGSVYEWAGSGKAGAGRMEIVESSNSKIVTKLDFYKPFKANNTAEFILEPQGDSTVVTWAMYGPNTFPGKVMSIFINCEKMIGDYFDEGLTNLKALTEKS